MNIVNILHRLQSHYLFHPLEFLFNTVVLFAVCILLEEKRSKAVEVIKQFVGLVQTYMYLSQADFCIYLHLHRYSCNNYSLFMISINMGI